MNKKKILEILVSKAKDDLVKAQQACESTKALNQDADLKQEGKYDTRAIEAGYLAGAQLKRVEELKLEVQLLEDINFREFSNKDEAAIGAIVELKLNDKSQFYFLSPTAGGTFVNLEGKAILVISVFSPIGKEVIGLRVGDSFELQTPKEMRQYELCSLS